AATTAKGAARVLRQNHLHIVVWSRNDVDRHQFTDALCRGGSGICGGFHSTDIAAYHHSHQPTANIFTADEGHVGSFDHGIGSFDRADETFGLNHSKGYHCNIYGHG